MKFVENTVPKYIWSTHKDDITNPESIVNAYLTTINNNICDGDEAITFTFFQAAVATYNTGQLLGVLNHYEILNKVFEQAVNKSYI